MPHHSSYRPSEVPLGRRRKFWITLAKTSYWYRYWKFLIDSEKRKRHHVNIPAYCICYLLVKSNINCMVVMSPTLHTAHTTIFLIDSPNSPVKYYFHVHFIDESWLLVAWPWTSKWETDVNIGLSDFKIWGHYSHSPDLWVYVRRRKLISPLASSISSRTVHKYSN